MSLKYRIALTIFVLEVIMMGFVLRESIQGTLNSASRHILAADSTVLIVLEEFSRGVLLTEEYVDAIPIFESVGSRRDVVRALLADRGGSIVVSLDPADLGERLPDIQAEGDRFWLSTDVRGSLGPLGIVAVQFTNEAFLAEADLVRNRALGIAVAGMTLIGFVGVLIGVLLTRRLSILSGAAKRLADGDASARARLPGGDEIAQLGEAFDSMADSIERERSLLEEAHEDLRRNHETLRRLQEISNDANEDFDSRIRQIVSLGMKALEMELGLLARVDGEDYLVTHVVSEADLGVAEGDVMPLAETYCREVVETRQVVEHADVVADGLGGHPAYSSMALGSYVGVPVRMRGEGTAGIFSLTRREPRSSGFAPTDQELLVLMAQRISQELERKASRAERDVLQSQFVHAQKMEAVGRLAGGVAHDFNNLLAVIIGNVELVLELVELDPGTARERARNVLDAAERAAMLTRRLLTFSRGQILKPRVIDVGQSVLGMADLIRQSMTEAVEIQFDLAHDLWACTVDPAQLEGAILNLVINAKDAIGESGGPVTLQTANVRIDPESPGGSVGLPAGDYVMLSVRDRGSGIPEDILGNVFDPFFTTKPPGKGTGLGLSMVYGFAKQAGGEAVIDSEGGRGTTVKLYFPKTERVAPPASVARAIETERGRGETILVVEDDPAVLEVAKKSLEFFGYNVLSATDAASALDVLRQHDEVELVFTDIVLPGAISGVELLGLAKSEFPKLKVLLTSGYANARLSSDLEQDIHVLKKPYRMSELADTVRIALQE